MQIIKADSGIDAKLEYEISGIVKASYERLHNAHDRAKYISDYLDDKYGGCWRVIIGKQYQSCGTYYLQQLLQLTYNNDQIEICRTQGDAQFEIIFKDQHMQGAISDSIILIIQNAQQMYKNTSQQTEYIIECIESKHQGHWGVISGYDYNCRIPYLNNNYICIAKTGVRYTVFMISK